MTAIFDSLVYKTLNDWLESCRWRVHMGDSDRGSTQEMQRSSPLNLERLREYDDVICSRETRSAVFPCKEADL